VLAVQVQDPDKQLEITARILFLALLLLQVAVAVQRVALSVRNMPLKTAEVAVAGLLINRQVSMVMEILRLRTHLKAIMVELAVVEIMLLAVAVVLAELVQMELQAVLGELDQYR
jgi:ABC-type enterobactin transport system permease subunit